MDKSTYRTVVVTSVALPIAGLVAELAFGLLPQELTEVYDAYMFGDGVSAGFLVLGVLVLLLLALSVVGLYGLLRFRSWAPRLNLGLALVASVVLALMGPVLMSALGLATMTAGSMLYGAALALAWYAPPVRHWFWPESH